jgi:hypothetical protein
MCCSNIAAHLSRALKLSLNLLKGLQGQMKQLELS